MLSECSDQLAATRQSLNTTDTKLKDAVKVPNGRDRGKDKTGGKVVEHSSDSSAEKSSTCCRKLDEARADLHAQEMMMKNCSSRLAQARDDELAVAATAIECSHHRNWLQQQLEEYRALFLQNPVAKEDLPGVKKQDCDCAERSTRPNKGKEIRRAAESSTGPKETAETSDSANEQASSCVRRLTETQANLTVQETLLKNCSGRLKQERANKLAASATAKECARELDGSRDRLETKTATLAQCENELKQTKLALSNAMDRCPKGAKSKPEAFKAGLGEDESNRPNCRSTKSKVESAKLTKCNNELTTALETVRWKTKQLEKCADNLVRARGEVQSLTTTLSETNSAHETIVENLQHRCHEQLENVKDAMRYCQKEIEQVAAACEVDLLLVAINISILVIVVILLLYYWLFRVVGYNLLLLLANYNARWFQILMGIRGRLVLYRVNFARPRYR